MIGDDDDDLDDDVSMMSEIDWRPIGGPAGTADEM